MGRRSTENRREKYLAGKCHELWNGTGGRTEIVLCADEVHTVCDVLKGGCACA